ncbi:MAG TPA: methyltransferase [Pirellulales bacterium]|nr:methyltransferase [Pirellulales bacterium]
MRVLLKPTVLLAPADDGYLAFDLATEQLFRLNALAALIVELADGCKTQGEILSVVVPLLGQSSAAECAKWIAQASEQGLLIDASTAPAIPALTADELCDRATQLRNTDRVLAAFLCQQRATELAPDDPDRWYRLGELAHIVGRRVDARTAYERYQESFPDDAEVEHLLIALRDETPPGRASDRCIEQLYAHFASFYDQNMCGDLDYRAPQLLFDSLAAAWGRRRELVALDVGCGTGLFGKQLAPVARRLVGIDLSAEMIDLARERGIYDQLEKAELTQWLGRPAVELYDVIAICDTLIYFGDLNQVLPSAARHLAPGGVLGFTVEKGEQSPFRLTESGRFTHHQDHLLAVADSAGYQLVSQREEILRYEYGQPVAGWVTVLLKAT